MSKFRIKPLSEDWINEVKSLSLPPDIFEKMRKLIGILHTCDTLIEQFKMRKRPLAKTEHIQLISYYFWAHCYHLGLAVYHLSKLGFGTASVILVRSIIEAVIDFSYLWLCKEINGKDTNERVAWIVYANIRRNTISQTWNELQKRRKDMGLPVVNPEILIKEEVAQEYAKYSRDFEGVFGRKKWAKKYETLDSRAKAVDKTQVFSERVGIVLEEAYIMCYRWASEVAHVESAGARAYLNGDSDFLNIDFGASGNNVDIAVPMAARFLLGMVYMVDHINRLDLDVVRQYESSCNEVDSAGGNII